jgi:hypothetical protein
MLDLIKTERLLEKEASRITERILVESDPSNVDYIRYLYLTFILGFNSS